MQRQKLLRRAAPFLRGRKRVVIAMSHGGPLAPTPLPPLSYYAADTAQRDEG
jgi:hypothetical protein